MGLCFSKNKKHPTPQFQSPPPQLFPIPSEPSKKSDNQIVPNPPLPIPIAEDKHNLKPKTPSTDPPKATSPQKGPSSFAGEIKKPEAPATPSKKKKIPISDTSIGAATPTAVVVPTSDDFKPAIVRTSSCTKEEVDAILIQCGRLSRSSSGKAAGSDAGGANRRRYSGSKRSYDFDNEKRGDNELEDGGDRPLSRPSPQRRTSGRERSGSRERDGSGRRVSRSPGRRSEVPGVTASDRSRQPAKMVSVPAREKTRGVSPSASNGGNRRCASPRSRSPATSCRVLNENGGQGQGPSLSRSSSRKAEQSPYRRNPLSELDENVIKGSQNSGCNSKGVKGKERDEVSRKEIQVQAQRTTEIVNVAKVNNNVLNNCVREQLLSCRGTETMEEGQGGGEIPSSENKVSRTVSKTRSSMRSSRDLDNVLNQTSYNSLLLEDIQNYHQITLPACVSKACSILEAVADLNSTSSENKLSSEVDKSSGRRDLIRREPFVESEIGAKEDLMEPSLHRYVTVRGETEPQESAGSNSFVGQAWSCSWEPRSVESSDRYWTSKSMNADEVEHVSNVSPVGYDYQDRESETRGRRSRGVVSQATLSSTKRSGVSGSRVGGRANSIPVTSSS